ncbi:peptidase S41 family protein-like protein [Lophiostoma macrostomum CBS 122681]|uniref:Peptidase S41 family protein-like protein n=1 Tax=Lophiostoma macrostomum CBS 122681 TaxID=1314788 RepID=A0A6A6SI29_9PLEO|nr:peptidase S41 family protein-like protein [Lophiostoma macrostomum CBS 122681]
MRSTLALQALAAIAAAQNTLDPSSTLEPEPTATATETSSGPINTGRACRQISNYVGSSADTYPIVDADLANACLSTIPIDSSAASSALQDLKKLLQYQSTLSYIKTPPEGFYNKGVDLEAGVDDIATKVSNNTYTNEHDFEDDIARLLASAHDGHLNFMGYAYAGIFQWRRSRDITLVSASSDGKEVPKIWAVQDLNVTSSDFTPSAVSRINGQDALQFLVDEAEFSSYHDPDTRFNDMLYKQAADSYGTFANPHFYPGPNTNVTFENGTSNTYPNTALVIDGSSWESITDGDSMYQTFIVPSASSGSIKKQRNIVPRTLQHPRDQLSRRAIPETYPDPDVSHSAADVPLAGYFVNTSAGTIGVLMVQTFDTDSSTDTEEFQSVVQSYISDAQSRGVKKHIIDIRQNGGGKVLLGYDMYLQFFPSQEPQLLSRYREHTATDLLGSTISQVDDFSDEAEGLLFTSPFDFRSYLDSKLKDFTSWDGMMPPDTFNGDNFTSLLRYNLSDPLITSSNVWGVGITLTGYGPGGHNSTATDPFNASDIILLSDGICASTCSLFTELMVQQSGVKTLAIGGRPSTGPMQPVGGTKGSLVVDSVYLNQLSSYMIQLLANTNSEANEWSDELLSESFAINVADASVNFHDNIRKGLEKDGTPTQFLNDSASCRMWYTGNDYINVTNVWARAAEIAFGKDGGLDGDACVEGSLTSQDAQTGQGSPTSTQGSGTAKPSSSKGAASGVVRPSEGWFAVWVCGIIVLGSMGVGASLI